jgi:hypothetical protein
MAEHVENHTKSGSTITAKQLDALGLKLVPIRRGPILPMSAAVQRPSADAGFQCPLDGCKGHYNNAKDLAEHINNSGHGFHYGFGADEPLVSELAKFGIVRCPRCELQTTGDHVCHPRAESQTWALILPEAKSRPVAAASCRFPIDVNGQTATGILTHEIASAIKLLCDAADSIKEGRKPTTKSDEEDVDSLLEAALYFPLHACYRQPGEMEACQNDTRLRWATVLNKARGAHRNLVTTDDAEVAMEVEVDDSYAIFAEEDDMKDFVEHVSPSLQIVAHGTGPNAQKPRKRKQRKEKNTEEWVAAHAAFQVRNGSVGRGSALLKPSALHQFSPAVRDEVKRLLPQNIKGLPRFPIDAPRIEMDSRQVKEAVMKLGRGAAPGMTGCTDQHLRALVAIPEGLSQITRLMNYAANGDMPSRFYQVLHSTKITALCKDHLQPKLVEKNVRPVGPPETIKKLLQRLLLQQELKNGAKLEEFLKGELAKGNAFGLHGPEAMLRRVRREHADFKEKHGEPIIMKMDMENGYGQAWIGEALYKLYTSPKTKCLARFIYAVCGIPISINMRTEQHQYEQILVNTTSTMQGDITSPAIFSLAVMPYLEAARTALRKQLQCDAIEFFAYIDDIVWLLPDKPNVKSMAVSAVNQEIKKLGSSIKEKKTLTLYPVQSRVQRSAEEFPSDPIKAKEAEVEFIDILGAPFIANVSDLTAGGKEKVQQFVYERMMDGAHGQQHLHRLQRMRDPAWGPHLSAGLTIIRVSILPSSTYIVRNTPPQLSSRAVKAMDEEVTGTVAALLRIKKKDLTENQRTIITLPLDHGGLGIKKVEPLVEETVRSASNAAEKKESRQRVQCHYRESFNNLVASLEEEKDRVNDPVTAASATIMLDHLQDYDRTQPLTMNTSARYIFQATAPESGSLLLRIYNMMGFIPTWLRGTHLTCAMCKKDIPLIHRLDHGARCERVCKTQRHDTLKLEARDAAQHAMGIQQVRIEEGFKYAPNQTAEPVNPPKDLEQMRSDLSFYVKNNEDLSKLTKVVIDFGITVGGPQGRSAMERTKEAKYNRIKQWATEPFLFIPAIMDTRGTMQYQCEELLRYISMHYQVGVAGSYSNARVQTYLGDVQARAMRREFTMFLLTMGQAVNCDPAVIFGTNGVLTPPSTTGVEPLNQVVCGGIAERKRKLETDLEMRAAASTMADMEDRAEEPIAGR